MQIILLERVEKLGQMGDIVKVKDGYARNYLLPKRKALRATDANHKQFETQRVELEARNLEQRKEAEGVANRMVDVSVTLVRQASDTGQLYGSVSARDIAESLAADGYKVTRQQVNLDRPIKTLGLHGVRVQLHPEVSIDVEANVARSVEEAERQKKLGGFEQVLEADAIDDEADSLFDELDEDSDDGDGEDETGTEDDNLDRL